MQREKKLIVRKESFLSSAWNEYIALVQQYIPRRIAERFFTRKAVLIAAVVVAAEAIIAVGIYVVWFRDP